MEVHLTCADRGKQQCAKLTCPPAPAGPCAPGAPAGRALLLAPARRLPRGLVDSSSTHKSASSLSPSPVAWSRSPRPVDRHLCQFDTMIIASAGPAAIGSRADCRSRLRRRRPRLGPSADLGRWAEPGDQTPRHTCRPTGRPGATEQTRLPCRRSLRGPASGDVAGQATTQILIREHGGFLPVPPS